MESGLKLSLTKWVSAGCERFMYVVLGMIQYRSIQRKDEASCGLLRYLPHDV